MNRSEVGLSLFVLFAVGDLASGISGDITPSTPKHMRRTMIVPATGFYVDTRFVFNSSGVTIPANQVVRYLDGSDQTVLECATAELSAEKIAGIAPQDIPTAKFGFVVCGGKFAVLNDSGAPIAAGDRIRTTATGGIATNDETTAARVAGRFGIALAAIPDATTGLCELTLP